MADHSNGRPTLSADHSNGRPTKNGRPTIPIARRAVGMVGRPTIQMVGRPIMVGRYKSRLPSSVALNDNNNVWLDSVPIVRLHIDLLLRYCIYKLKVVMADIGDTDIITEFEFEGKNS